VHFFLSLCILQILQKEEKKEMKKHSSPTTGSTTNRTQSRSNEKDHESVETRGRKLSSNAETESINNKSGASIGAKKESINTTPATRHNSREFEDDVDIGRLRSEFSESGNIVNNSLSNSKRDQVAVAAAEVSRTNSSVDEEMQAIRDSAAYNNNNNDNNNNGNNNGEGGNDHDDDISNSPSKTIDSLSTAEDNMNDNKSHSTTSSQTINAARKSSLPFGMTMPVMMTLLILIPILFLAVYTGITVQAAIASQKVLADHRQVIQDILYISTKLQEERRDGSAFLASAVNTTRENTTRATLLSGRALSDARYREMIDRMQDSDLDGKVQFLSDANSKLQNLYRERQRVDDRTVSGPDMRNYLLLLVEEVYGLMTYVAKDSRGKALESRIIVFMVVRRIQNSVGLMRAIGVGILNRDGYDTENLEEFASMRSGVSRDMLLAKLSGKPEVLTALARWEDDPLRVKFWAMADQIQSRSVAVWSAMNVTEWANTANALISVMNTADNGVLDIITNGELLNQIAMVEGMKMFGAILACILAAALVIFYNNREQARLEKALDATAVLAAAVQRFVPKNQLKTMGVRSITQVQAGMATEVASALTFSDIRNFTRMAESMTRLELFEWLQNYVSRMSAVIKEDNGYLANFLGDGLFIVHNQPSNAMRSAVQMNVAVDALNLEIVAKGGRLPITIGCGSTYDVVVASTFGDEYRITASLIGTGVNLASRLEGLTKSFGNKILASQTIVERISSEVFSYRCVGKVQVSGSVEPMVIYDIFNSDALEVKEYKMETKQDFETAVKLCETQPEEAQRIFNRVALIAQERNIKDKALQNRLIGIENDINASSASSSVQQHYLNNNNNQSPAQVPSRNRVDSFLNSQINNADSAKRASNNNTKTVNATGIVRTFSPRNGPTGGESPHQGGVIEFEKNGDIKTPPRSPHTSVLAQPIHQTNLPHMSSSQPETAHHHQQQQQQQRTNDFILDVNSPNHRIATHQQSKNNSNVTNSLAGSNFSAPVGAVKTPTREDSSRTALPQFVGDSRPKEIFGTVDGKNYGVSYNKSIT
jgi:class 3 adenylate cyclase